MNICVFGDYDSEYNRNRVLLGGLVSAGASLSYIEIHSTKLGVILRALRDVRAQSNAIDVILVPYSESRLWVPLLFLISRKPIVWDAFFSRYDTIINDRALASRVSLKALYHWIADWLSVHLASTILLDTHEHINYFIRTFGRRESAYVRVLVGAEDPHNN